MAFFAWFQKYGYTSEPLSIKPNTEIVARDSEINILSENLVSGNIVLLQGEAGLGKSSILMAIEKNFRGEADFDVRFVSMLDGFEKIKGVLSKPGLVESFLVYLGFWKKKKMVLLLDESQFMLFNQAELLRNSFDCDRVHSLLLAAGGRNNLNLSLSFQRRVCEQLTLSKLSRAQLKDLLKIRLNGVNPLHEETIDFLAKISDGNPRQFLINCKKVCIKVHEFFQGQGTITAEKAKEVVLTKIGSGFDEKKEVDEKKHALANLTPLQKSILLQLKNSPMNLSELSEATGSSIGTIGKQISVLSLKTKKEYMARKGVTQPLINKDKDQAITIYHLTESAKKMLSKNQ